MTGNTHNWWSLLLLAAMPVSRLAAQIPVPVKDTTRPAAKLLQDVVVTGQFAPQSLRNSVYNVRVVKQEQIKMRGATDIAGVLNNELGIRFSTDYTLGETDIKIQGMGGQRVKILLDGVPLIDRDAVKQSLAQIDIHSIERIEIVEGPMSVIYGTDALAGVINIITKKGNAGDGLAVNASMQEGSAGNAYNALSGEGTHNQHIDLLWQQKGWQFSAYGTRNTTGGYNDTAAFPAKVAKPKDQWITGGTLGYRNDRLETWYRIDYLDEKLFSAGVMSVNTYTGFDQYYITNRYMHQAQAAWKAADKLSVNLAASYQDYKRKTESYTKDYRNGEKSPTDADDPNNAGQWDVSSFRTLFLRGTAQWTLSPLLSLQPGIEIKSDKTSGQRVAGNPAINDYAVFTSAEIRPVRWINIRPGTRFSKNSVYNAPPFIPSVNTRFTFSKNLDLRLAYARGFRAPILRELYFDFHDASHSIDGNPDLKAEYSNSFTGSLTWQNNIPSGVRLRSAVSGFYNHFHDFIRMAFDAGRETYSYFNLSDYKTTGATLENSISYKTFSATLGFSYLGRYNPFA
ncbi:MAG TPA: TonB-dependent receptor, partial [Chitinophagaceae bacterium]|nr:TonB-dependent receptor [Chitinophagaceae bacterium]